MIKKAAAADADMAAAINTVGATPCGRPNIGQAQRGLPLQRNKIHMRKMIIAGNWKLNKTINEAVVLATVLKRELADIQNVEIVICPVYPALAVVNDVIMDTNIKLGGQDLYWKDSGAFTGEVSAPLLKDVGCEYVIIGHSERRQFFGETNETVNKKTLAALVHGLTPIVCVGETLQEREAGETFKVVEDHIHGAFQGLTAEQAQKVVVAYEPVWAIGTGKTATPAQAQEVHKFIRDLLAKLYDQAVAEEITIQYGGSVKPDNAVELMSQPDIDGALVGGASLDANAFVDIVKKSATVARC